jgi:GT2 family glycosyltransferase
MGNSMKHLNIFTLTWNGKELLTKLKNSLIPALSNINWTWFIKDNNSLDNTVEEVLSWGDNIKVIAYKNNLQNFSQGNNLLFNEAAPKDEDYILLLNNDIIFNDKSSIKKMIKIMEENKNVGVVGARLKFTNTNNLQHAGVVFSRKTNSPLHFRLNQLSDNNAEKNRLFQVVTGAVLLTKAEYYKKSNKNSSGNYGLDENYCWSFDDVDLCLAIYYNLEKKVVYCGSTDIYHEDSSSLKKMPSNRLFLPHNLNVLRTKWASRFCFDHEMYEKDSKFNLYL